MKRYKIKSVESPRYPVLRVTFEDGLAGDIDFGGRINSASLFAPLRDEAYFRTAAAGEGGRSFGWNLDVPGREIDFCADAARIEIETGMAEDLAARHQARRTAAE